MKLKILSLFTGIGAFEKALKNIGAEYELKGFSEIDKYAIKSYCAIHEIDENMNLGDISKINISKLPNDIDLITHGSPCQDFSVAGKQAGAEKGSGTRSSLMWYTVDIVEKVKPKFVVWENVKNILSKKHKHNFDNYIKIMKQLGYNNYYQVLNAKDYGIPQNRERVYTISIRKDIDQYKFKFPEKEELKIRLKDILENKVDEKYYLSSEKIKKICNSDFTQEKMRIQEKNYCDTILARDYKDPKCVQVATLDIKGHDSVKRVYSENGISPTLTNMQGGNRQPKVMVKNATKQGYIEAIEGDSINLAYPNSKTRRGRVGHQISQTLTVEDNMAVLETPYIAASRGRNPENPNSRVAGEYLEQRLEVNRSGTTNFISTVQKDNYVVEENIKIRKLTPKECWRLMGFTDNDFEKAKSTGNSNTQLYKQAGNSIVVKVLEKIFINLLEEWK